MWFCTMSSTDVVLPAPRLRALRELWWTASGESSIGKWDFDADPTTWKGVTVEENDVVCVVTLHSVCGFVRGDVG